MKAAFLSAESLVGGDRPSGCRCAAVLAWFKGEITHLQLLLVVCLPFGLQLGCGITTEVKCGKGTDPLSGWEWWSRGRSCLPHGVRQASSEAYSWDLSGLMSFKRYKAMKKSMSFCLHKFNEPLLKVWCIDSDLFHFKCQVCLNFKWNIS